MKYIIDLPEGHEVAFSDGQQTKIIQPDKNEMVVFNDCEDILKIGFVVKLTPYEEHDTAEQGWELARHLYNVSPDVTEEIYWSMNGGKGLGVALEMPYAEAKAKYDAWQKRKNEIKIGDEGMAIKIRDFELYEALNAVLRFINSCDGGTHTLIAPDGSEIKVDCLRLLDDLESIAKYAVEGL